MIKEEIFNDFVNLDFNRINKKQKSKARDYITDSLQGLYKLEFYPRWCIIPLKRCYNLESENSDYEILLTAHYDTHHFRQNYIQAFITRKVQYGSTLIKIVYYLSLALFMKVSFNFILKLAAALCISLKLSKVWIFFFFLSLIIALVITRIVFIGLRIFITGRNVLKSAPVHDDNNSGIITLIHVAKLLHKKGYSDKIKLLFTDCEEKGLLGSQIFIKNNLDNLQDKIIINFDCVGRGSNLFITSKNNSELAKELQSFLSSRNMKSTLYTKSYSDDRSFQKKRLKSIGLIRGDIAPKGIKLLQWTHTSHDTLNNINLDYITEIVQVVTEFIESKI